MYISTLLHGRLVCLISSVYVHVSEGGRTDGIEGETLADCNADAEAGSRRCIFGRNRASQ